MESDLNSFLDNSNTYKRLYEIELKDDKIKQDIEIISDIKIIDEKSKVKASNKLKEELDNDKFRFSILRLSDGIKRLNEDTALKLAHNILIIILKKLKVHLMFHKMVIILKKIIIIVN